MFIGKADSLTQLNREEVNNKVVGCISYKVDSMIRGIQARYNLINGISELFEKPGNNDDYRRFNLS